MSNRDFTPIEKLCPDWPQARFVILSFLPDEIEFESNGYGTVSICTDFVRPILESIPNRQAAAVRTLSARFNWIAQCLPMTLPTPVELQHFNGLLMTPAVLARIRDFLRQHHATRMEMGLPTSMQIFHHGLGLTKCPVPIDPDW